MRIRVLPLIALSCLSASLAACASGQDGMTIRETRRIGEAIDMAEDRPFRTIIDATAIIESADATPSAKLYALETRAAAETRTPSPDWAAIQADLEAALVLAEPFSDAHRRVTMGLARIAIMSRDYLRAAELLTAPALAWTEETTKLAAVALDALLSFGLADQDEIERMQRSSRSAANRDAVPLYRVAPSGFERCLGRTPEEARAVVRFDLDEQGRPQDVRVAETTDSCYDRYAVRAVERWRYEPAMLDGVAVRRPDVRTTITFNAPQVPP